MLCVGCSFACCIKAGCKTDKEAQKAALCLRVVTLRGQLVHGGHHGITLTCRVQDRYLSSHCSQSCLQPFTAMMQEHLAAVLAWNELHCGGCRDAQSPFPHKL